MYKKIENSFWWVCLLFKLRKIPKGKMTIKGERVINGFHYVATKGIPLEIVLLFFKENNIVMDWMEYIESALKDGHNLRTVKSRILSAAGDVYGKNYRDEIEKRLIIAYRNL